MLNFPTLTEAFEAKGYFYIDFESNKVHGTLTYSPEENIPISLSLDDKLKEEYLLYSASKEKVIYGTITYNDRKIRITCVNCFLKKSSRSYLEDGSQYSNELYNIEFVIIGENLSNFDDEIFVKAHYSYNNFEKWISTYYDKIPKMQYMLNCDCDFLLIFNDIKKLYYNYKYNFRDQTIIHKTILCKPQKKRSFRWFLKIHNILEILFQLLTNNTFYLNYLVLTNEENKEYLLIFDMNFIKSNFASWNDKYCIYKKHLPNKAINIIMNNFITFYNTDKIQPFNYYFNVTSKHNIFYDHKFMLYISCLENYFYNFISLDKQFIIKDQFIKELTKNIKDELSKLINTDTELYINNVLDVLPIAKYCNFRSKISILISESIINNIISYDDKKKLITRIKHTRDHIAHALSNNIKGNKALSNEEFTYIIEIFQLLVINLLLKELQLPKRILYTLLEKSQTYRIFKQYIEVLLYKKSKSPVRV